MIEEDVITPEQRRIVLDTEELLRQEVLRLETRLRARGYKSSEGGQEFAPPEVEGWENEGGS